MMKFIAFALVLCSFTSVRKGYAILFSLSYTMDEDLQTMRQILRDGDFALR